MDLMPFSEIDNDELDELFPKPYFPEEYEVGYDADGNEWVHARGVWYPCLENIYQDIDQAEDQETDEWASIPPPAPLVRQTNERRACDVFGLSTVDINDEDQDGPPAPLLQDPLDYPLYDYEDPRNLD